MENLTNDILSCINKQSPINSIDLAKQLKKEHLEVVGALKSIQSHGDLIHCEQTKSSHFDLTSEGSEISKQGSYEYNLYSCVPREGISLPELMKMPNAKIGFSKAMANRWIKVDKSIEKAGRVFRIDNEKSIVDDVQKCLQEFKSLQLTDSQKSEFKKRKLIIEVTVTSYNVSKGKEFSLEVKKLETELTADMISSESWRKLQFKSYNFSALGVQPPCGHLHPLLKVRSEFRRILMDMGFSEMPTNNYVESSFWNFDALFQPQQHPARDAHDTFFLSEPAQTVQYPQDYLERVKQVHSSGGFGSQGYRYDWKESEAQKNLLRTHTTAVSARMLYKLAQQKEFEPVKYFSIDRVFRNETLDATHLAEFHQIEGLVADRNLTLGHLKGVIHAFFRKLGLTKLRFKPAFNPYTEPSMEIFSYHEGLKKWVEVGNSGMFRPEMLLPMGLPEDVTVIAWGLSLERPTMIKYGYDNIRDLIGPKVDLKMVNDGPICRLEA